MLLIGLALACLLPGIVGATLLFIQEYQDGRTQLERDTIQTARALMQAVDNQVFQIQSLALGLAASESLMAGDLAKFDQEARRALQQSGLGTNLSLAKRTGELILHTRKKFGESLPQHGNPELPRRVFEAGRPVVSDLFEGGIARRPVVAVAVPVFIHGQVAYAMTFGILPEVLNRTLEAQNFPPGWVAAILDSTNSIVARTREAEKYLGQKPAQAFLDQRGETAEGVMEFVMNDGVPAVGHYTRSPSTHWSVVINVPQEALDTQLIRRLTLLALGLTGLFTLGLGVAWLVGTKISRSVKLLTAAADALGQGKVVSVSQGHIKETAEVASAISRAAFLLSQRSVIIQQLNADLEKRVEERTAELKMANQGLEEFTFAVSHDLRGPLGRINSFSTLLEQQYRDQLEGNGLLYLEFVRQNSTRLAQLVDDLLHHARIAHQTLKLRPVDVLTRVRVVVEESSEAIRDANAEVRINVPSVRVLADHQALTQTLSNLVQNALKYSAPAAPPVIEIGGEECGTCFLLWVRDNGIGFDMAYHDRIFEIFRRLHTYNEYDGSGVGLALVKRAMERMGGKVWADSQPGHGATFFLEFQATSEVIAV